MFRDILDHSRRPLTVATIVALTLTVAACGRDASSTEQSARPTSPASVEIIHPRSESNAQSPLTVEVRIDGGSIVAPTRAPLAGNFGHVHLVLDGGVESQMLYGPTFDLGRLDPGPHTLQAEFVATDHLPFANRPNATVVFNVT